MINITVTGRKIHAAAIIRKWPEAIVACKPNKKTGDTLVEWDETTVAKKTVTAIINAQDEYEAAQAAEKYKDDRRAAYGPVEDQLDMIYWDQVNGTTIWRDHVAAAKAKYPKPS